MNVRYLLTISVLLVMSCAPEKPSDVEANVLRTHEAGGDEASRAPVAIVNGEAITLGEFERRLASLAPFARARYGTTERKQEYLANMVQFEVLADEAERRGYGQAPVVLHAMKETMVRELLADVLRERVNVRDIDEARVQAYIEAHGAEFEQPERRRAVVLRVDDRARAEALRARFEAEAPGAEEDDVEARINAFRLFAHRHSTERVTAEQGGDLGWLQAGADYGDDDAQGALKAAAARAVFALEAPGEGEAGAPAVRGLLTEPFELEGGDVALAMIMDVRPREARRGDDVEREVRARLFEEAREAARAEFIDELMRSATVETFAEKVESLESPSARRAAAGTQRLDTPPNSSGP